MAMQGTAPVSVRFGREDTMLVKVLRARARAHRRSISDQIKYYTHLAVIAEDNPDLPLTMVQGILEGQAELKAGLGQPYQWGVLERDA